VLNDNQFFVISVGINPIQNKIPRKKKRGKMAGYILKRLQNLSLYEDKNSLKTTTQTLYSNSVKQGNMYLSKFNGFFFYNFTKKKK
jgi:hypothetical protein